VHKYVYIIFSFLLCNSLLGQRDSIINFIEKSTADSSLARGYYHLGKGFIGEDDSIALYHFKQSYRYSKRLEHKSFQGHSAFFIAYQYADRVWGLDSCIYYSEIAEENLIEERDSVWKLHLFQNLAVAFEREGYFQSALENYYKASSLASYLDNTTSLISAKAGIAVLYHDLEDFNKGIKYAREGLELLNGKINTEYDNYAFIANALAINYDDRGDHDSAIMVYNQILDTLNKYDPESIVSSTYNNIGNSLKKLGNYEEAKKNFLKSYEVFTKSGSNDFYTKATIYNNLGDIYSLNGDFELSKMYLDSSMYYSKEMSDYEKIRDNIYVYYKYYKRKGDVDSALFYNEWYHLYKDSIIGERTTRIVNDLETSYRVQKKENENALLKEKTAQQELEIAEAQTRMILILAGAVLLLLIFLFGFRNMRLRQKAQLAEEKEKQQQDRFKAVIEAEEHERTRIARELHDGLGQILSTAKLNVASLEGELDDAEDEKLLKNSMDLIDHSLKEVRSISHNLMPTALIEKGLIQALKEQTEKINEARSLQLEFKTEGSFENLSKSVEIALYRIIQEVLNNMIRHSGADKIEFTLFQLDGIIRLKIKDNGKGFDTKEISKSKGIGWKNIFSRVSMIDGIIDIDSKPGKGTDVKIEMRS
jgi:signal transduction histidine kinase